MYGGGKGKSALVKGNTNVSINTQTKDKTLTTYNIVDTTDFITIEYCADGYYNKIDWAKKLDSNIQYTREDSENFYGIKDNGIVQIIQIQNYDEDEVKNTIKKSSISGTLITRKQLIDLGCSVEDGNCSSAPDWLKVNLISWNASALNSSDISVYSFFAFDGEISFHEKCLDNGMAFGVRPVITINKSEI